MNILDSKIVFKSAFILLFTSSVCAASETDYRQGINFSRVEDCSASIFKAGPTIKQNLHTSSLFDHELDNMTAAKLLSGQELELTRLTGQNQADYNTDLNSPLENNSNRSMPYFTALEETSKQGSQATASNNKPPVKTKQGDRMKLYLSGNLGYDDNIESSPNDAVINSADMLYDLYVSLNYQISGDTDNGWVTDASYFRSDYSDSNNYDFYQSSLGLKKQQRLSDWLSCMRVDLVTSTYAGEDYQSTIRLTIKGRKPLSQGKYLYLTYLFEDIDSENLVYNYLEGWRQKFRLDYHNRSTQYIQQIYYELEVNQRGTLVTSSYAYDYSPQRHTVYARYTRILDTSWRLSADIAYRISDYPASSTMNRIDDQLKYSVSTVYYFDWSFRLITRLEFTDNQSSVDRYSYDKSVFKIGFSKRF